MAQFTSYDTIGAKEDVSDVITNITPTDTPFQSSIRTEKVQARTFSFQEDTQLELACIFAKTTN